MTNKKPAKKTTSTKKNTIKKTPAKKTPPKPMPESNERFTDLYQVVANNLLRCEPFLLTAKLTIDETDLLKPNTKKALLERIKNIFTESNTIVAKIGQLGKV